MYMDNEANLSWGSYPPSALNPEEIRHGDFTDQEDYKAYVSLKKALDMLCSMP